MLFAAFAAWLVRVLVIVVVTDGAYDELACRLGTQISTDYPQMLASLAARRIAAGFHRWGKTDFSVDSGYQSAAL